MRFYSNNIPIRRKRFSFFGFCPLLIVNITLSLFSFFRSSFSVKPHFGRCLPDGTYSRRKIFSSSPNCQIIFLCPICFPPLSLPSSLFQNLHHSPHFLQGRHVFVWSFSIWKRYNNDILQVRQTPVFPEFSS